MEQRGLRGSSVAKIDEKGRLKVPSAFRSLVQNPDGPDVFVTSVTGDSVRIYPMAVWLDIEQKLVQMADNHPSRLRFLDRVNYFGQMGEVDSQGRVLLPPVLRETASMVGDVRVFGRINYLDIWNEQRFIEKLRAEPWTDEDALKLAEYGI